jgi:hypothetical protein
VGFPASLHFFEIFLVTFVTPKKRLAGRSAASMMSLLLPTEQQYLPCRPLADSLGNIDYEAMRRLDGLVNRGCSMMFMRYFIVFTLSQDAINCPVGDVQ